MSNILQKLTREGFVEDVPSGRRVRINPQLRGPDGSVLNPDTVTLGSGFILAKKDNGDGTFDAQNITSETQTLEWTATWYFTKQYMQSALQQGVGPAPGADPSPAPPITIGDTQAFLDLIDVIPNTYAGSESFGVQVNAAGTGLVFFDLVSLIEGIKYSWLNAAQRNAQIGMVDAELGVQRDTGDVYRYDDPPGVWNVFFNLQDGFFSTAVQGEVLFRGPAVWQLLPPGNPGEFLQTQGPGADVQWAPAPGSGQKEAFFSPQYSSTVNVPGTSVRTRPVTSNASFEFSFVVPGDFSSLVSFVALANPRGGAAGSGKNIDLFSDYGANGEQYNHHSESDVGSTYNLGNAGQWTTIDISSVLTQLSAGDRGGVQIDHQNIGGIVDYLGLLLTYT